MRKRFIASNIHIRNLSLYESFGFFLLICVYLRYIRVCGYGNGRKGTSHIGANTDCAVSSSMFPFLPFFSVISIEIEWECKIWLDQREVQIWLSVNISHWCWKSHDLYGFFLNGRLSAVSFNLWWLWILIQWLTDWECFWPWSWRFRCPRIVWSFSNCNVLNDMVSPCWRRIVSRSRKLFAQLSLSFFSQLIDNCENKWCEICVDNFSGKTKEHNVRLISLI